jgi:hypothetical protein
MSRFPPFLDRQPKPNAYVVPGGPRVTNASSAQFKMPDLPLPNPPQQNSPRPIGKPVIRRRIPDERLHIDGNPMIAGNSILFMVVRAFVSNLSIQQSMNRIEDDRPRFFDPVGKIISPLNKIGESIDLEADRVWMFSSALFAQEPLIIAIRPSRRLGT